MNFLKELNKKYPTAKISLDYSNAFELLVATILSAQCTDKRVNIVTKKLFKKYKTIKDYANAPIEELEKDVKSTGFYRNKAKSIQESAKIIIEKYNGKVPKTMKELLTLKGVARKTANVVLGNYFGINEGIVVDTHIKRISYRVGITKNKIPEKVEVDLMKIIPKKDWTNFSHKMIYFGRETCKAPTPICSECFFKNKCPKNGVTEKK